MRSHIISKLIKTNPCSVIEPDFNSTTADVDTLTVVETVLLGMVCVVIMA